MLAHRRRLAAILLLPACVLLGAYLTLPLWLPPLVRVQLAPAWQLESLEFDYPAGLVLHVDNIVLSGNTGGTGIRIAARDLDINIHRLSVDVSSMNVDIALADAGRKTDFFDLDELTVPVIFRPGKLPRISVDSLRLNLQSGGMIGGSWLFTELQLEGNETAGSRLKTKLPLPGVSDLTGQIEIHMLHDSLEANLQLLLPDHSKVLQIDFRQSEKDQKISSEVLGQVHLQDLQPLLMAVFPGTGSPLGQLKSVQGQVTFEGHFSGHDKQILNHTKLSAQNVVIDLGNVRLGLDVKLDVQREEGWVLINFPAAGKFRFSDHSNRISSRLGKLLPVTQNNAHSAEGINDSLLLIIEPHSEIRLQTGTHPAGEFSGAASLELSSALLDLSLKVAPDGDYATFSNGRIEGQGELLFAGDIRTPVRFSGGLNSGDWVIDILPSQLSLGQAVKALEIALGTIPGQIELGDGTIDIEGSLSLGNAVQGELNIRGKALSFSLGQSTVEGVDFDISGILNETLSGKGWFSIERIGLAAGLDLFQARVSVSLMTPDTIELNDLQAGFFGGQLSTDYLRLSPQGLSDTQIEMTDIDLGKVLEYIDVGGLKGTGKLAISLPAGSQGSSLYIRNGVFRANGPGILSYSGSLSATPAENIGLSALENFHYSELDGTIDYNPDGSYQLMVHLAGSNPDLYDGYPIALKLNISGMLPEAFEVLFLTGDFDQAILNRIRQEKLD